MPDPITLEPSRVNGHDAHGLTSETTLAGFTAVNGDRPRKPSFRPGNVSLPPTTSLDGDSTPRTFSWRPDDSAQAKQLSEAETSSTGKRKRSESSTIEIAEDSPSVEHRERSESPKRRMTTSDSAIDVVSPTSTHRQETVPVDRGSPSPVRIGPYQRERSPVARWNQRSPPPTKAKPETEAGLIASIQQFQQTQQVHETQSTRFTSPPASPSSPQNDEDDQDGVQVLGEGKSDDKTQRKRNFSNRTKSGCHTCRRRKKKCDERKPICQNCERGQFECQGYGAKPPGGIKSLPPSRSNVPLQSKTNYPPHNALPPPAMWQQGRTEEGRSYSHWGRIPQPPDQDPRQLNPVVSADPRRPSTQDGWTQQRPPWSQHDPNQTPTQEYRQDRLPPPPSFPHVPSQQPGYGPDPRSHPPQHTQPLPPRASSQHILPPHPQAQPTPQHAPHPSHQPPAMLPDPWPGHPSAGPYQHHNSQPFSSNASVSTSSSHRSMPVPYPIGNKQEKKEKMMRGQPFDHYMDRVLISDRYQCRAALERFNKALESNPWISMSERAKLFAQIIKPRKRADGQTQEHQHYGPEGKVGDHFLIEAPFKCQYGYNIHIGDDTVVESGCYFQDAADISIGNRCIISHNVKFYCMTASLDPSQRSGSRGQFLAGAIKVEDGVFIGGDSIILPFVTIGKGVVIGAGSVVTRDVEEHTVVAGNPAKPIRSIQHGNKDKRHDFKIQKQQEKMIKWMGDYANSGYKLHESRFKVAESSTWLL